MKNYKKFVVIVIVALVIVGAYFYPKSTKVTQVLQAGAVGDVNATPRMVQTSLDLSTTTPTTPSALATSTMFNNDGRDRIVTSIEIYGVNLGSSTSNGTTLANWRWRVATSTDIYTVGTNAILDTIVSTSTAILYVSSSTPGLAGTSGNDWARIWKAGTYLNLFLNGTSTGAVVSSAQPTTSETGLLIVHYRQAP